MVSAPGPPGKVSECEVSPLTESVLESQAPGETIRNYDMSRKPTELRCPDPGSSPFKSPHSSPALMMGLDFPSSNRAAWTQKGILVAMVGNLFLSSRVWKVDYN